jgi:two-component system, NarL family, sensor kinase
VRERAELVGGSVRVTSRPGTGTTVAVTAPLDTSPGSEESAHNT